LQASPSLRKPGYKRSHREGKKKTGGRGGGEDLDIWGVGRGGAQEEKSRREAGEAMEGEGTEKTIGRRSRNRKGIKMVVDPTARGFFGLRSTGRGEVTYRRRRADLEGEKKVHQSRRESLALQHREPGKNENGHIQRTMKKKKSKTKGKKDSPIVAVGGGGRGLIRLDHIRSNLSIREGIGKGGLKSFLRYTFKEKWGGGGGQRTPHEVLIRKTLGRRSMGQSPDGTRSERTKKKKKTQTKKKTPQHPRATGDESGKDGVQKKGKESLGVK